MDIPDFVRTALDHYLDAEGDYYRTISALLQNNERPAAGWLERHSKDWAAILDELNYQTS